MDKKIIADGSCLNFVPQLPFLSNRETSFLSRSASPSFLGKIKSELKEIRVCTNRTCRRQGAMQTLETLTSLAPPDVTVKLCGCLGQCGAGPNIVALPHGVIFRHCGTAARTAEIILELCGLSGSVDSGKCLEALALRKRAETEIEKENFLEAELLLSQAIELKPFGGVHVIYKDRSFCRQAMGNYSEALEDAREALRLAPHYVEGYICEGDAFLAMDQCDAAKKSYAKCLEIDPSVRRSKSFKNRIIRLQARLPAANTP